MVIVFIIGVLLAVVLPRLAFSRARATHTSCVSNVRILGTALQTYANDNDGRYPPTLGTLLDGSPPVLKALPVCPSDESSYETLYEVDNSTGHYTVACNGIHYRQVDGGQQGYPQFYSSGRLDPTGNP